MKSGLSAISFQELLKLTSSRKHEDTLGRFISKDVTLTYGSISFPIEWLTDGTSLTQIWTVDSKTD